MDITKETLAEIFKYHPPFGSQQDRYIQLRACGKVLAQQLLELCPPSRERSNALTRLQEVIMWANAAIAINEQPPVEGATSPPATSS